MSDEREDSLEALKDRLLVSPMDHAARSRLASLLFDTSRVEEAFQQVETWKQLAPDASQPFLLEARLLLESGQVAASRAAYERARSREGFVDEPELMVRLGLEKEVKPSGDGYGSADQTAGEKKSEPEKLRLLQGGRNDPVVPLKRLADHDTGFLVVVGMEELKKSLRLSIIEPFRNPKLFRRFRKRTGGGFLLYGPPGCGKTLIARALAEECGSSFINVSVSDVLNMYFGESERKLAELFLQARQQAPSVLFFDELDALAYSRSKSSSDLYRSVVNEFLSQLDGFNQSNDQILVLGATNMPWDVDPAMKRAGRFARMIFVPPPDEEARAHMFRQKLGDVPKENLDYALLSRATPFFSGADIDGVIDHATELALEQILLTGEEREISMQDLKTAIGTASPSTLDWLQTARNLVRYAGAGKAYADVEKYLKKNRIR